MLKINIAVVFFGLFYFFSFGIKADSFSINGDCNLVTTSKISYNLTVICSDPKSQIPKTANPLLKNLVDKGFITSRNKELIIAHIIEALRNPNLTLQKTAGIDTTNEEIKYAWLMYLRGQPDVSEAILNETKIIDEDFDLLSESRRSHHFILMLSLHSMDRVKSLARMENVLDDYKNDVSELEKIIKDKVTKVDRSIDFFRDITERELEALSDYRLKNPFHTFKYFSEYLELLRVLYQQAGRKGENFIEYKRYNERLDRELRETVDRGIFHNFNFSASKLYGVGGLSSFLFWINFERAWIEIVGPNKDMAAKKIRALKKQIDVLEREDCGFNTSCKLIWERRLNSISGLNI